MGVSSIIGGGLALAGAALSARSSKKALKRQEAAQERAAAESREAAKRNVTVQSSSAMPSETNVQSDAAGEQALLNARKRRRGYASTLTSYRLTSGLLGNKSILGG